MSPLGQELRRGWRELAGATIGLSCGIGCYTPVSSLFFRAIEHQFGWSRFAAALSLAALPVTAVILPFTGACVDRYGSRRVCGASALLLAGCFLWLSMLPRSLTVFYAAFMCLNIFGCATGPVGYTRAIAAHFRASRGTALAVALLGIASAGAILPIVLTPLLAQSGWRAGYRFLALIALLGGGVAAALIRPRSDADSAVEPVSAAHALRSSAFWILGSAIFCVSAASIGFVTQFQSIAIEKGVPVAQAALLLSTLAVAVVVSRLVVGRLLDGSSPRRVAAFVFVVPALGAALWLAGGAGLATTLPAALMIGASLGAELDMLSFFCARCFGVSRYATVYGALSIFFYTGMAAGGIGYGLLRDMRGSYAAPVAASAAMFVLTSILFLLLPADSDPDPGAEPVAPAASTRSVVTATQRISGA
jgi:predicted MFS family arabinose efflux permease